MLTLLVADSVKLTYHAYQDRLLQMVMLLCQLTLPVADSVVLNYHAFLDWLL